MIWLRRIPRTAPSIPAVSSATFLWIPVWWIPQGLGAGIQPEAGDTDVVDSTYGSHVMYFVGTGLPVWKAAVVNTLRSDDVDEWTNSLVEGADVSQSDFGMKFVG